MRRTAARPTAVRLGTAITVLAAIALSGCSSDNSADRGSDVSTTSLGPTESSLVTPTGSEFDCDTLRVAFEQLGILTQFLPQVSEADDLVDPVFIADPSEQRDAIAVLRPVVGNDPDAAAFLDDLGGGLDAIEAARAGTPGSAVADIESLTGGISNAPQWLARQVPVATALDTAGC